VRILYMSMTFPLPVNNGHKMRTWFLLRALKEEGHRVTLLALGDAAEIEANRGEMLETCSQVAAVPFRVKNLSSGADYGRRILGLFSRQPYAAHRFLSPELRALAEKLFQENDFDAIISDTVFSVINLPPNAVPLILNHADMEHEILLRYARREKNIAKKIYARLEAGKVRDWELKVVADAALSMTCSDREKNLLQPMCPKLPVFVVPNAIDTDLYALEFPEEPNTVIYMGGMDWYPNRDAVEYFVEDILPALQKSVPNVRFVVAGRNPSAEFRAKFAHVPAVSFTGTVPDMRPLIGGASVCVVPLRMGSGTRLKILEAAAMSKAVVSTSLGAEGLDFADGRDIVIRDDPGAFAQSVAELLIDPARRRALGDSAHNVVSEKYSLTALRASLRGALAAVASNASDRELVHTAP